MHHIDGFRQKHKCACMDDAGDGKSQIEHIQLTSNYDNSLAVVNR
jgi:hypothetical protein